MKRGLNLSLVGLDSTGFDNTRLNMDFTSLEQKFDFPDERFQGNIGGRKHESSKSFTNSEVLSKRTPKCARWELRIKQRPETRQLKPLFELSHD